MPWLRRVPGPLVVLVAALPLSLWFGLDSAHAYSFQGQDYQVGPEYLVQLPGSLLGAIAFPDFSVIVSATSIKYIVMFTLVGSIESLLSAKAVDTLDPERRQSDLDRDLFATGAGNVVSGLIGGLRDASWWCAAWTITTRSPITSWPRRKPASEMHPA